MRIDFYLPFEVDPVEGGQNGALEIDLVDLVEGGRDDLVDGGRDDERTDELVASGSLGLSE